MFKVNAVGQAIPAGNNLPIEYDEATVVEGCGGELVEAVFDPVPGVMMRIQFPAGTYTIHGELVWAGTPHASRSFEIVATDQDTLLETTGSQLATELDLGPVTFPDTFWVTWRAGINSGVHGQSITSASFLEVSCGGVPWTVGRVSWGSRGAWH